MEKGPLHMPMNVVAVVGIPVDTGRTDYSRHLAGLVCIVASCSWIHRNSQTGLLNTRKRKGIRTQAPTIKKGRR